MAGQFMTSSLPILKKNHSGGDRVVLELVTLFPHFLGSQYPPVAFLFGGNSALNKFNQTLGNAERTQNKLTKKGHPNQVL